MTQDRTAPVGARSKPQSRASNFRQRDVEKALGAAKASGLDLAASEVKPDGTIRLIFGRAYEPANEADRALERWHRENGG